MSDDVQEALETLETLRAGIKRHARGEPTTLRWTDDELKSLATLEAALKERDERIAELEAEVEQLYGRIADLESR